MEKRKKESRREVQPPQNHSVQQRESIKPSIKPFAMKEKETPLTPSTPPPAVKQSESILTPSIPPPVKVPVEKLSHSKMREESQKVVNAIPSVTTKSELLEMKVEERIDKYMVRSEGTVKRIVVDVDQFRQCEMMFLIMRCRGYIKWLYYYCASIIPFIHNVSYKKRFTCLLQMCF